MNYHHPLLLAPLVCMVAAAETLGVHELQGSWEGRTALEYAAASNHAEVVQILLRAGATRIPQALQLAEQYGAQTTAAILRKGSL